MSFKRHECHDIRYFVAVNFAITNHGVGGRKEGGVSGRFVHVAESPNASDTRLRETTFVEGRPTVNTKTVCFVALLFGFAAARFGSDAGAQTEVKAKDRDAVIEKCIARAHREYPDPGEAEAIFRARAASYKACMAENGQAP